MDLLELRNKQEPLKEKYRQNPAAALVTLKATSHIGAGINCKIETGKMLAEAGLHPATGGDGLSVCSGDMLLEALAACAGVTLKAVATSIGFHLSDAHVHVEGDLDFRGTLSVDRNAPVGFKDIRLRFQLDTDEPQEKIGTLIKLTERYCVVYQTLVNANAIHVSII
ncbi:MAG: OsmC family peroxiredoxin [Flavobacteriales bacterium]|nr:MAG: OsmC family peroxiredoxin [Flavobacteriales bacterium]